MKDDEHDHTIDEMIEEAVERKIRELNPPTRVFGVGFDLRLAKSSATVQHIVAVLGDKDHDTQACETCKKINKPVTQTGEGETL